MKIGEKISRLRTSAGLSQEQLADRLEVSRQSVSKWEINQSDPRIDKIVQMCELFSVSADELLREDIELYETKPAIKRELSGSDDFKGKYFGTDGFRGEVNADLTAEQAFRVGRFLGWYYASPLSGCRERNYRPRIIIGKDTRRSSYMLEYSIASGIAASGADVYMLHVTTTPSVSYVTRHDSFDCGITISASHNEYMDNGIKLVNRYGEKMDDSTLAYIEQYLDGDYSQLGLEGDELPLATRDRIGAIVDHASGRNRYIGYLISIAAHSYKGMRIGLDCANGAAWMIAPSVFDALGAKTYVINAEPDGKNINRNAGSTHIEALKRLVRENNLDVGFAFDGDADRCIAVDEKGNEVNGDHIIYILACRLKAMNNLNNNTVVTTVMSNGGLTAALGESGISNVQTKVGDRYVYECMTENGYLLGGEQSGHIILQKYATTGDGILTALMVMEEIMDRKLPLSKLAQPVKMYPQKLKSIRVISKAQVMNDSSVTKLISDIESALGGTGRVILRESGTEPVIRIMVECEDGEKCSQYVDKFEALLKRKGYTVDE